MTAEDLGDLSGASAMPLVKDIFCSSIPVDKNGFMALSREIWAFYFHARLREVL